MAYIFRSSLQSLVSAPALIEGYHSGCSLECSTTGSPKGLASVASAWEFHLKYAWSAFSEIAWVWRHLGTVGWPDFCIDLRVLMVA